MFNSILTKIMGSQNERELKRIDPIVSRVNELEHTTKSLSDVALLAKTDEFRKRVQEGENLDDLLPEAFAVVLSLIHI